MLIRRKRWANPTQGVGFVYNPESQSTRITAIQAVVAQYLPSLESGSVDLDTYYPEFIDALKAAGVDEVIADKQQQFDDGQCETVSSWIEQTGRHMQAAYAFPFFLPSETKNGGNECNDTYKDR